jgi:hypothetical protein
MRVPLALLSTDFTPVWDCRLWGRGTYQRMPRELSLVSPPDDDHPGTFLALDDDPARNWFKYTLKIRGVRWSENPERHQTGVFFGWRRNRAASDGRFRFFVVRIVEPLRRPERIGRLQVGTSYLDRPGGNRGNVTEKFRPLSGVTWEIDLPPSNDQGWHELTVEAVDHRVRVSVVGSEKQVTFDVRTLRRAYEAEGYSLDARGALGIWCYNGNGYFRDVWVTAQPSEEN